ncbi:hypothetical protein OC834_005688 [Tilletia horrida]|nr:hypothetical protein OC834_005688 [Tilletia horrida]
MTLRFTGKTVAHEELAPGFAPQSSGHTDQGESKSGYGRYTIKVSEPGKFHRDGDFREWVEEVRDYIGFHNLRGPPMGQNEQVLIAATYLKGDAKIR